MQPPSQKTVLIKTKEKIIIYYLSCFVFLNYEISINFHFLIISFIYIVSFNLAPFLLTYLLQWKYHYGFRLCGEITSTRFRDKWSSKMDRRPSNWSNNCYVFLGTIKNYYNRRNWELLRACCTPLIYYQLNSWAKPQIKALSCFLPSLLYVG